MMEPSMNNGVKLYGPTKTQGSVKYTDIYSQTKYSAADYRRKNVHTINL